MKKWIFFTLLLILSGCTTIPAGVTPVTPFDLTGYMGRWYEIARLDHSFEAGLTNVTADYRLNADNTVTVINHGWDAEKRRWRKARGHARLMGAPDTAYLKVSFFGPFYSSYIVFFKEDDAVLVSGYNKSYFWILSRNREISTSRLQRYLTIARQHGFDTSTLVYPIQTHL